jgi:hypothetical protein
MSAAFSGTVRRDRVERQHRNAKRSATMLGGEH